jgi:hypothetical protein
MVALVAAGIREDRAVAEHRYGTVVANCDDGREGVVVAVAAGGGVASASDWFDGLFGAAARHKAYAELAKYAVGVKEGGSVDLGERVAHRREVCGVRDP